MRSDLSFINTGERFVAACRFQGVTLAPGIVEQLRDPHEDNLRDINYQSPVLATTQLLARSPETLVGDNLPATRSLDLQRLPGVTGYVLGATINTLLDPGFTLPEALPAIPQASGDFYSTCSDADRHWLKTYQALTDQTEVRRPEVEIFLQGTEPILLRKAQGHPTGLLLQRVGNIREGAIVQVETNDQAAPVCDGKLVLGASGLRTSSWESVRGLRFDRMSPIGVESIAEKRLHFGLDWVMEASPTLAQLRHATQQQALAGIL